ncbi:hypothetical protein AALP_AAs58361U000100 [Arabis alpina]|uniref:Uncharacterized protein n=1 Tax=Arabis alpina TaxID=50452 RepID=A0A087FWH2_ARAAL|nr:hypothetical protein AALP_AAs58361U000100 [Arabis alpina]
MESLDELDLTDCWLLKKYPHISTNIPETTKEEIPVRSRLELRISHWENLGVLSHAFKYIGKLHLRDKRIHEISPWIKELSRLQKLVIKGCTKLVSLPQLPDSLRYIDAENCESLERLHCSFHNREFDGLHFANCFKLSQEARDLIIKTSTSRFALLPGAKVPPHFTYRATGSFLSVKLNGVDTNFATSLRLKACVMLVDKGDIEVGDWTKVEIIHRMKEKQNGVNVTRRSIRYQSQLLKKHLCIFHVEERVRSSELVFEFEINDEKWEIGECGILYPQP